MTGGTVGQGMTARGAETNRLAMAARWDRSVMPDLIAAVHPMGVDIARRMARVARNRLGAGSLSWAFTRDDVDQAIALGISQALPKWDPERGAFTSCCRGYVRKALLRDGMNLQWRGGTPDALIRASKSATESVRANARRAMFAPFRVGVGYMRGVAAPRGDPEGDVRAEDARDRVGRGLAALERFDPRMRRVLESRYGIGGPEQTLGEIGRSLGVTKERARQIHNVAMARLARIMADSA